MTAATGSGDQWVLDGLRQAISETLGLLEDDAAISPDATLAGDLGINGYDIEPILIRLQQNLGVPLDCVDIAFRVSDYELGPRSESYTVGELAAVCATAVAARA